MSSSSSSSLGDLSQHARHMMNSRLQMKCAALNYRLLLGMKNGILNDARAVDSGAKQGTRLRRNATAGFEETRPRANAIVEKPLFFSWLTVQALVSNESVSADQYNKAVDAYFSGTTSDQRAEIERLFQSAAQTQTIPDARTAATKKVYSIKELLQVNLTRE